MTYFLLRHLCQADRRLAFDVLPYNFVLLNQGTAELMQAFLTRMGVSGAVIESWSVRRCCSPYYADDDRAPHFCDRYKQFFRVEISLAEPLFPVVLEPFKSWSSDRLDPTWAPPSAGDLYEWEELPCVLIANFVDERDQLGEGIDLGGRVRQLRWEVGPLRVNGDDRALRDRLHQLDDGGAWLNHRTSYTYYLYHLDGLPPPR